MTSMSNFSIAEKSMIFAKERVIQPTQTLESVLRFAFSVVMFMLDADLSFSVAIITTFLTTKTN